MFLFKKHFEQHYKLEINFVSVILNLTKLFNFIKNNLFLFLVNNKNKQFYFNKH